MAVQTQLKHNRGNNLSATTRNRKKKPRVTVKDLARDLGMSVSTVSRAFYTDAIVAPQTRDLVLKRAREIGYKPNPFAQSLITKKTKIVGLLVSDITNPFYPEVLTRLTEDLQAINMNVMLMAASDSAKVDDSLHLLLAYQPDLVIIMAASLSSEATRECRAAGSPCIFFNRLSSEPDSFGITCENREGGRRAADYLIDNGHKSLTYVSAFPDASTNVERSLGFAERCIERGLPAPSIIEAQRFSYESGYDAAAKLEKWSKLPDGVFCANDIVAIGFIDGVREQLGLKIPEDMSVIGFDDINMSHWLSHNLTTIRQPVDEMLTATVALVKTLSANAEETPFVQRFSPSSVIERGTTRNRNA